MEPVALLTLARTIVAAPAFDTRRRAPSPLAPLAAPMSITPDDAADSVPLASITLPLATVMPPVATSVSSGLTSGSVASVCTRMDVATTFSVSPALLVWPRAPSVTRGASKLEISSGVRTRAPLLSLAVWSGLTTAMEGAPMNNCPPRPFVLAAMEKSRVPFSVKPLLTSTDS